MELHSPDPYVGWQWFLLLLRMHAYFPVVIFVRDEIFVVRMCDRGMERCLLIRFVSQLKIQLAWPRWPLYYENDQLLYDIIFIDMVMPVESNNYYYGELLWASLQS